MRYLFTVQKGELVPLNEYPEPLLVHINSTLYADLLALLHLHPLLQSCVSKQSLDNVYPNPDVLRLQPSNYQALECKLFCPHFDNKWSDLSVLGRIFVMKFFYLRNSDAKYPKFFWLKGTQHFSIIIMEVFYCTCSCGHLKLCVHKYIEKCLKLGINCCFRASV